MDAKREVGVTWQRSVNPNDGLDLIRGFAAMTSKTAPQHEWTGGEFQSPGENIAMLANMRGTCRGSCPIEAYHPQI